MCGKKLYFILKLRQFLHGFFFKFLPDNENKSRLKPVKKIDRVSCLIFEHTMIFLLNCKFMNSCKYRINPYY